MDYRNLFSKAIITSIKRRCPETCSIWAWRWAMESTSRTCILSNSSTSRSLRIWIGSAKRCYSRLYSSRVMRRRWKQTWSRLGPHEILANQGKRQSKPCWLTTQIWPCAQWKLLRQPPLNRGKEDPYKKQVRWPMKICEENQRIGP